MQNNCFPVKKEMKYLTQLMGNITKKGLSVTVTECLLYDLEIEHSQRQ